MSTSHSNAGMAEDRISLEHGASGQPTPSPSDHTVSWQCFADHNACHSPGAQLITWVVVTHIAMQDALGLHSASEYDTSLLLCYRSHLMHWLRMGQTAAQAAMHDLSASFGHGFNEGWLLSAICLGPSHF